MLALWSRATQNPGTCRCISNASNVTAITSRRGQNGLRYCWASRTPPSTFCNTTIFIAGLTIGAKAKLDRNRQWEEAFAQLREALNRPLDTTSTSQNVEGSGHNCQSHGLQGSTGFAEESEWSGVRQVSSMELRDNSISHEPDNLPLDHATQTWDDLRLDSRMPGAQTATWPANTGRDMIPYHLPPQSLWAPDTLRWAAMRRRHTRKKLAMQELSAGLLIHNLIRHADLRRILKNADGLLERLSPQIRHILSSTDDEAETVRRNFLADIERLHLTDVRSSTESLAQARNHISEPRVPSYIQDADGDFYDICKQMNAGILQLLRHCGKGNDKEKAIVIAKICHNLLVSTSAPDLQTFNILISGFTLWRRPNLVDDVIAAFFVSKIRPNELACKQILDHYTTQSRPDDFSRFVAKMRGVGDALTLADPSITINEAGQERLLRVSEKKVYQKVHPTPMVFAALIGGVMKFAGFDRALDVYYEMKADGWGLAIPELIKLLGDCIRRADWEGGIYVWEEINNIKARVKPSYIERAYHHMLSLCSVTGNTAAFNQILNEVTKRGFDQRSIINAAMKTTRWAQHKRATLAPAWAADNLMIAVSGYLDDTKSPNKTSNDTPLDEAYFDNNPFVPTTSDELSGVQKPGLNTAFSSKKSATDSREAWSSWVEHEFGERPKDPEP